MKFKFIYPANDQGGTPSERQSTISVGGEGGVVIHYDPAPESVELGAGKIVKVTDLLKSPEKYRKSFAGTEREWKYLLFICCVGERNANQGKTPKYIEDLFLKILREMLPGEKKPGTHRAAGHLFDQMLKPATPIIQGKLFGELDESIKAKIENHGIEVKHVVQGVQLSATERKVVGCLIKILHHRSSENNYLGNSDGKVVTDIIIKHGDKKITEEQLSPELIFTLYELAKEYNGGKAPSGKEIDNIKEVLRGLDSRNFLFSYTETIDSGKTKTVRKVEDYKKLIHIIKLSETTFEDDIETSNREETIIQLNPIFRNQIDTKFIEIPDDLNKRLQIAARGSKISEVTSRLVDYLLRGTSTKGGKNEIYLETLYNTLAAKWMQESRKKKVRTETDKAVEICKRLGLLKEWTEVQGKNGELKAVFSVNRDWI